MPKSLNRGEELPAPFLRQRRNLLLTSVFLIYVSLFVKQIDSVEFAPIKVTHVWDKPHNVQGVLGLGLLLLAYFSIRAWQRMDVEDIWITPEAEKKLIKAVEMGVYFNSGANSQENAKPVNLVWNAEINKYHFLNEGGMPLLTVIKTANKKGFGNDYEIKFGEFYDVLKKSLNLKSNWDNKKKIVQNCLIDYSILEQHSFADIIEITAQIPPKIEIAFTKEFINVAGIRGFHWGDFFRYPYLSDYLFPFFLANFAACCVLVRLLPGDWSNIARGIWLVSFCMVSVIVWTYKIEK